MKFKIWLKALGKALNPEREEKYITTLQLRIANKTYKYGSKLIKLTSDLPKYVYNKLQWYLIPNIVYKTYNIPDIYELKKKIKQLDDNWIRILNLIKHIRYNIDVIFEQERETINYNNISFIKYRDCFNNEGIAYLTYVSDRGNGEIDMNVRGEFFDEHGTNVDIDRFDRTYLITPMTDDKDFKRFMNLYTKKITNAPLHTQTETYKHLNDAWCKQLTYLKLKEE
jgi:hypothetical protein